MKVIIKSLVTFLHIDTVRNSKCYKYVLINRFIFLTFRNHYDSISQQTLTKYVITDIPLESYLFVFPRDCRHFNRWLLPVTFPSRVFTPRVGTPTEILLTPSPSLPLSTVQVSRVHISVVRCQPKIEMLFEDSMINSQLFPMYYIFEHDYFNEA